MTQTRFCRRKWILGCLLVPCTFLYLSAAWWVLNRCSHATLAVMVPGEWKRGLAARHLYGYAGVCESWCYIASDGKTHCIIRVDVDETPTGYISVNGSTPVHLSTLLLRDAETKER